MNDISKIDRTGPVHPDGPDIGFQDQKKHQKKKHGKNVKKHLDELTRIVHETHEELEAENSPFRICVYQEDEDIFIDIVTIDASGKIDQVFKHDISHAELEDLIQQIKSGRGLILDEDA